MVIDATETETLLEGAIRNEIPVSFQYWPANPEDVDPASPPARRMVSPYELKDGRDGKTLLVCWSHGSDGIRAFDTARIVGVQSEVGIEDYIFPVEA